MAVSVNSAQEAVENPRGYVLLLLHSDKDQATSRSPTMRKVDFVAQGQVSKAQLRNRLTIHFPAISWCMFANAGSHFIPRPD